MDTKFPVTLIHMVNDAFRMKNFKMSFISYIQSIFFLLLFKVNVFFHVLFPPFFYINRRKYWFRSNIRFPIFDGFTRFGIPEHNLTIYEKCLCVCDKNFVVSIAQELINRI